MMRSTLLLTLTCWAFSALAATPPEVMSAEVYTPGVPVTEYWVSEKLDGVRGRWDGQQLWSRGGHRIHAPDWFVADWPDLPMDGELWIGRDRFERAAGIIRRHQPDDADWRELHFKVFDLPAHGGPFSQRVEAMRALLTALNIPWLQPVEQFRVADETELEGRLAALIAVGGEGLMLHHQDAHYHSGRSDQLLKLKPHEDAEARVVGYRPGSGKYQGQMGALEVETANGIRFAIGSGYSDAQRAAPPPLGAQITYRHNGYTRNGIPRFARFLRVRDDEPQHSGHDSGE